MIKIFRNIRRKLLRKNQFHRYLIYAIGEIILVVIGILIALQINNWNEEKKEQRREMMYLQSLQIEIKESQLELKRVSEKTERISQACIELLKMASDTVKIASPVEFDSLVIATFGYTIAMTNEGTIKDIMGSGDLKVIKSDSLRRMIASWDAGFKMIREREDLMKAAFIRQKDELNKIVDLQNSRKIDGRLMEPDVRVSFLRARENRNKLVDLLINSRQLNRLYKEKYVWLNSMRNLAKKEIDKLN